LYYDEEVFDYVSNTYLVFRKIKEEYDYLFDYDDDKTLNNILIDKIKRICELNLSIDDISKRISTIKKFEQFCVCSELYYNNKIKQGYNLLFLEYQRNRILLNYIKDTDKFEPIEKYYITNDSELEDFSLQVKLYGKDYLIINTFDSFVKYSELHKLPLSRDSNEDFFFYLGKAIEYNNRPIKNGTINSVDYLWNIYKYMVIDNVILIIDYDCPEYLNE
jgi:hypothetical protein